MRTIVLVNAAAGAVASGRPVAEGSATEPPALSRLQEAVRQAGLQAEVVPVEPHQLPQAVAQAAAAPDIDAVCVAGGDGTDLVWVKAQDWDGNEPDDPQSATRNRNFQHAEVRHPPLYARFGARLSF